MRTLLLSDCFSYTIQMENIGISRLSAYLKNHEQSVDVYYLKENQSVEDILETLSLEYDLYGFSVYENNAQLFISLANEIQKRQPGAVIAFGSKFVTLYYQELLEYCENEVLCVLGDGEYTMLDMIRVMEKKENVYELAAEHPHIASRQYQTEKSPLAISIRDLPWPDRGFLRQTRTIAAYVCDCHGCVGNCSFCSQRNYYTKWEGRDAKDLFEEVAYLYHSTNTRLVIFTGGSFEDPGKLGKEKIRSFCQMIINAQLSICFRCYLRAETFQDTKEDLALLMLMKQAGFHVVFVGIESGAPKDLQLYHKRANVKDNELILQLLKKADIHGGGFGFIMFNPYSDWQSIHENYIFLSNNLNWDLQKYVSELKLYKNTAIYDQVKQDGLLPAQKRFSWNYVSEYRFVHEDMERLYHFVLEKIKMPLETNTQNIDFAVTTIESFYTQIEDGDQLRGQLHNYLQEQAQLLSSFFEKLYLQGNFQWCETNLNRFITTISRLGGDIAKLNRKAMKYILRQQTKAFDCTDRR